MEEIISFIEIPYFNEIDKELGASETSEASINEWRIRFRNTFVRAKETKFQNRDFLKTRVLKVHFGDFGKLVLLFLAAWGHKKDSPAAQVSCILQQDPRALANR